MTDYTNATPEERTAALEALGLTITSTFVPLSESRNAIPREDGKIWRSLNWRVTLYKKRETTLRTGVGSLPAPRAMVKIALLTADYAQGEAHTPAYKDFAKGASRTCVDVDNAIQYECEHGRSSWKFSENRVPDPTLLEVCYSLALDAQSGRDNFIDFCNNSGCDEDSRKAEAMWRACADIYRALGPNLTEAISRITEGY